MAADKRDRWEKRSETDVQGSNIHSCTPYCCGGVGLLRSIVWYVVESCMESLLKVWQVSFATETFVPEESLQSVILNYAPKQV